MGVKLPFGIGPSLIFRLAGHHRAPVCKYSSPLCESAALMRIRRFSGPVEHMAGSPMPGPSQSYQPVGTQFPLQGPSPRVHPITPDTQTRDLLTYIFSPPAETRFVLMQRFTRAFLLISDKLSQGNAHTNGSASSRLTGATPSAYAEWGALAHRLNEENFRTE